MKTFAALTVAGVAGFVALKLLAALFLPLMGLVFGLAVFAVKLGLITLVGFVVYSVLRKDRIKAAC